jgi:hypothetical protein
MECPLEEGILRMNLDGMSIIKSFDIKNIKETIVKHSNVKV